MNFKINSRPLFTIIFKLKNDSFKTRDFSPLIERVLAGVHYQGFAEVVRKADLPLAGSWQTCPKFVGSG